MYDFCLVRRHIVEVERRAPQPLRGVPKIVFSGQACKLKSMKRLATDHPAQDDLVCT